MLYLCRWYINTRVGGVALRQLREDHMYLSVDPGMRLKKSSESRSYRRQQHPTNRTADRGTGGAIRQQHGQCPAASHRRHPEHLLSGPRAFP